MTSFDTLHEILLDVFIWNSKHICVDGKSVCNRRFVDKGLISIGDLNLETLNSHLGRILGTSVFHLWTLSN